MKHPRFFGYGSLVNRATHNFPNASAEKLTGWKRIWCASPTRAVAYLSVIASPEAEIWGLSADVPADAWDNLDQREAAYQRLETCAVSRMTIYSIAEANRREPGPGNPVLLSYIDTVAQGYHAEFGPSGVRHFFETTGGWHAPILDDRKSPLYPRHQPLQPILRAKVDHYLDYMGARRMGERAAEEFIEQYPSRTG